MMIRDEIKKANLQAMKDKDSNARAIYSVLLNKCMLLEIAKREKSETLDDVDVIFLIQKTIKELKDEKENYLKVNNLERVALIEEQENLIAKFLPRMLGEEKVKEIILSLDDKSIPSVMRHFKDNYAGQVDMGLVNRVLKSL